MIEAPVGIHCPVCAGRMREGAVGQATYRARTTLERTTLGRRLTGRTVTGALVALNIVVAIFTLVPSLLGMAEGPTDALVLLSPLPAAEWWRLFTSMFLHLSLLHIAFNMYALSVFGPNIEERYGKVRFLVLYLLSGLGGAAATLQLGGFGASAGASGAIFGLFGAWLGFFLWHRRMRGAAEQLQSLLILLGLNAVIGFVFPGINFYAHGGGLVAGFLMVLLFESAARLRSIRSIESLGLGVLFAVTAWMIASNSF